jgi:hypothetical protein
MPFKNKEDYYQYQGDYMTKWRAKHKADKLNRNERINLAKDEQLDDYANDDSEEYESSDNMNSDLLQQAQKLEPLILQLASKYVPHSIDKIKGAQEYYISNKLRHLKKH